MKAGRGQVNFGGLGALLLAAALTPSLPAPAAAGFLDMLFGSPSRREAPPPPPQALGYANPSSDNDRPTYFPRRETITGRAEGGGASAFCVRTCDGHYFPVRAQAGTSAADMCKSFCPSTETKLFSGSHIDGAVAQDGTHYDDLKTAFLYRKQLVNGCTCNGKSPGGLANIDAKSDPTLRPGDIVATPTGLMAFSGKGNKSAEFTPISNDRTVPKSYRDKLSDVKIMPGNPDAGKKPVALGPPTTHFSADGRQALR